MKTNIQESFDQVRKALDFREKLLIRQVQVLEQQATQFSKEIEFIPDNQVNLLHLIRIYGRFNVSKLNVGNDYLSNEDYIRPQDDHVLINKQLIEEKATVDSSPDDQQRTADMHLAMVDDNANNINESLINLILSESKELIGKSKSNNNKNFNKEGRRHGNKTLPITGDTPSARVMESKAGVTIAPSVAVSSSKGVQSHSIPKKKFSSSLKSISNLTHSGTLNLRRPTAIAPTVLPADDVQAVTCDFYNRLINENKLLRPSRRSAANKSTLGGIVTPVKSSVVVSPSPSTSSSDTSSTSFKEFCTGIEGQRKKPIKLDNWDECDGLPMDTNGNNVQGMNVSTTEEDRPKQIQMWLKQIRDPEWEPMQNTDLMECSLIKSP